MNCLIELPASAIYQSCCPSLVCMQSISANFWQKLKNEQFGKNNANKELRAIEQLSLPQHSCNVKLKILNGKCQISVNRLSLLLLACN